MPKFIGILIFILSIITSASFYHLKPETHWFIGAIGGIFLGVLWKI